MTTASSVLTTRAESYEQAVTRFSRQGVARNYPQAYSNSWKDQAERRAILASLSDVACGGKVLDLPCGSGRLTPLLLERGFQIVGSDCSPPMVARAQQNFARLAEQTGIDPNSARFDVRDVMCSGFADGEFDAVICNRLFHHFTEPATRQAAFRELRRICRGPIAVSFFNSFALDSLRFRLKNFLTGHAPSDRIPISLSQLADDAHAAGLRIERALPTRWGISPMWYAVLRAA